MGRQPMVVQRFPWCRCGALLFVQREQRHDDTGGTESALAAMTSHHRRLRGMQGVTASEPFDGDQVRALKLVRRRDAGVDGAVSERLPVIFRGGDGDGAGAAVAGSATFLGAAVRKRSAQQFEHARVGRGGHALALAIEKEFDHRRSAVVIVRVAIRRRDEGRRPCRGILTDRSAFVSLFDYAAHGKLSFHGQASAPSADNRLDSA